MTYSERFGTVKEYAKYNANKYLDMINTDGYKYYYEAFYKHIDLLTYPEIYMTDKIKKEKRKAVEHMELLKNIADGKYIPEIYIKEWELFKDDEWPEWRK